MYMRGLDRGESGSGARAKMIKHRIIRRYAAYYRGWCTAFGEHESRYEEGSDVNWLFGVDQVGLILAEELRKDIYRELLRKKDASCPVLTIAHRYVEIGEFRHPLIPERDLEGILTLCQLISNDKADIHLYLTYHFMYPPGTRIMTFSRKTPLILTYKEVSPLSLNIITP
jgi:hypothetical protein